MNASHLLAAALSIALGIFPIPSLASEEDRAAATEAMLRAESLGDLRLGLPEKRVLELLGKPEKKGAQALQEADGMYVQEWRYPAKGISLVMQAEKKAGPKTIAIIRAEVPCSFATRQGIKIGSAENAVRKAYAAHEERDSPSEPGVFVAGSVYGGIIFNFVEGKVDSIFFGAAAE